jgi:hypothetical protein
MKDAERGSATDEAFLDRLQRGAFSYFADTVNPENGLVPDTSRPGSPVSIAVVGFALSSYPVGVERGWMKRADAARLSLAALRFFVDSEQSDRRDATGHKGFYYHFLDIRSGRRVWNSELSMIDTAFLVAGALLASEYFDGRDKAEREIRKLAARLYRRVDWRWAQNGGETIMQGWKPEIGFLQYGWDGYDEAIALYVLALGAPKHAIGDNCYHAWTSTYQWENLYGHDVLYAGPLFVHQFSHAWIDFRGIRDRFMREKGSDYFENSRRAVHIQRAYAERNPLDRAGYGEDCWGFSACDGPDGERPAIDGALRGLGYAARAAPYGPDDGTIACGSALASLPFEPDLAIAATRAMIERYPQVMTDDRLASGFNPSLAVADQPMWVSEGHYGLDQGIVVLMIENHRTGLPWRLLRGCAPFVKGLRRAGFEGGWL